MASASHSSRVRAVSARFRVSVAFGVGVGAVLVLKFLVGWLIAALGGWDIGTLIYVAWIIFTVFPLDEKETKALATREDSSRRVIDTVLLVASMVSLLGVGLVIASASKSSGPSEGVRVGLGVASVVASWALVHTVFTLHYARLYYGDSPRKAKIEDAKDQDSTLR